MTEEQDTKYHTRTSRNMLMCEVSVGIRYLGPKSCQEDIHDSIPNRFSTIPLFSQYGLYVMK
jgi:hypothetical protein